MRISSVSTIVLLLVGSLCCEAKEPTLYLLGNGIDPSQPQAVVKLQRTSNSGALLLLTFDGVDPRTFPSMEKIEARVKAADAAMQVHGGAGVSDDFPLAALYAYARVLRLADGPDEVHRGVIARMEFKAQAAS